MQAAIRFRLDVDAVEAGQIWSCQGITIYVAELKTDLQSYGTTESLGMSFEDSIFCFFTDPIFSHLHKAASSRSLCLRGYGHETVPP
jgi:hypothetical protein